ncbi:regulatory protein, luxR family [Nannocystis exedens]|uniref:Regulatory protein, luxR family n=1 Tax=Nannocystis exedens TaxID=54 RepID=A0A1I1WGU3_9BACT|nr:helix-turn-helix transcriptional regulator [Nannocystis exedens]PCC67713.1 helix-turn-helix transcriptional regulator [Nannocystis exedens]SFD94425.1 regulatory protein, luxR family [Nannocystis exedens]
MNHGSVRIERIERVLRVIAEARECQPAERRSHLVRGLLQVIGGRFATVLNISDFRAGGLGRPCDVLIAGLDEPLERLFAVYRAQGVGMNPALARLMENRPLEQAHVRVAPRRQLVDDAVWYRTPFVAEQLRAADTDDGICAVRYGASAGHVRGFAVVRGWGERPFEPEDAALVHVFTAAADGLLDDEAPVPPRPQRPLTPREARVLELLLGGQTEKQFAEHLGLSIHTIHQYTKAVFRAFGVSGRAELMAKFIPAGCAAGESVRQARGGGRRPRSRPRPDAVQ